MWELPHVVRMGQSPRRGVEASQTVAVLGVRRLVVAVHEVLGVLCDEEGKRMHASCGL